MLERDYQAKLIRKLRRTFPGCYVLKLDPNYMQGILDLIVLHNDRWALLEVKRKRPRPGTSDFEPNQEWYIEEFNRMSFAACIFPENESEVLRGLEQSLSS